MFFFQANLLGVHEKTITVRIENGTIIYTVTTDNAETTSGLQMSLAAENVTDLLNTTISEQFPGVTITDVEPSTEVSAEIVITVDTSDATNNIHNAIDEFTEQMENEDFTVTDAKSKT